MIQFAARRYDTGEPVRIALEGEQIAAVEPMGPLEDLERLPYVAPGFFDLQINGHGGVWFSDETLTSDAVLEVLEAHFRFGVTRLCPTLITNSFEAIHDGLAAVRQACEREKWADQMVAGCHIEGPYIAAEDGPRGAHPLEHVRGCDWSEFEQWQKSSGGRVRLVTLAAEAAGAEDFIRQAVASGVTVAIGHTAANSEQITAAVDAGARLSTHLGNGAHGMMRRHPNYIWDQLGEPRLTASIITDGHHLPPSVVRSIIFAKGTSGVVLTCDASGLAGCAPGEYDYHGGRFEVLEDGPIVVAGQRQYLAGSGQLTDTCVANAVTMAGLTLGQACDMAALNPCRLLGIPVVTLTRGSRADLILFRYGGAGSRLGVTGSLLAGSLRYGELPGGC